MILAAGLLAKLSGQTAIKDSETRETERIERLAMQAVMKAEGQLGFVPRDVSKEKLGYDIESLVPSKGKLRFIEVKGRVKGANIVTVTKNEILTALNKPDDFILAIVEVDGEKATSQYIWKPFQREPDFGVTSVNYDLRELKEKGAIPG